MVRWRIQYTILEKGLNLGYLYLTMTTKVRTNQRMNEQTEHKKDGLDVVEYQSKAVSAEYEIVLDGFIYHLIELECILYLKIQLHL